MDLDPWQLHRGKSSRLARQRPGAARAGPQTCYTNRPASVQSPLRKGMRGL